MTDTVLNGEKFPMLDEFLKLDSSSPKQFKLCRELFENHRYITREYLLEVIMYLARCSNNDHGTTHVDNFSQKIDVLFMWFAPEVLNLLTREDLDSYIIVHINFFRYSDVGKPITEARKNRKKYMLLPDDIKEQISRQVIVPIVGHTYASYGFTIGHFLLNMFRGSSILARFLWNISSEERGFEFPQNHVTLKSPIIVERMRYFRENFRCMCQIISSERDPCLYHDAHKLDEIILADDVEQFAKYCDNNHNLLTLTMQPGPWCVEKLLHRRFEANDGRLDSGNTILDVAVYCEAMKIARYLIDEWKVSVTSQTLVFACAYCGVDDFNVIYSRCEPDSIKYNRSLQTHPVSIAECHGNQDVCDLILSYVNMEEEDVEE
jgi:hypothetical protein